MKRTGERLPVLDLESILDNEYKGEFEVDISCEFSLISLIGLFCASHSEWSVETCARDRHY